jgi:hypothetical protein
VVGSGAVYHASRRAGTAPSYCSKGYPGYRQSWTPMCVIRTFGQERSGATTCLGHHEWDLDLHKHLSDH